MRQYTKIIAAAFAASIVSVGASAQPADPPPAQPQQPNVVVIGDPAAPARLAGAIQAIVQAAAPSEAIQAYAQAQAIAPKHPTIALAYVRRMVEFGLPEMAESQAQEVLAGAPDDGLARAVSAYMSAKRQQVASALSEAALAVKHQPDDPFVLRTAGQIVAMYEASPDRSKLPADAARSADAIHVAVGDRPAYAEAYRLAANAYKRMAEATAAPPAAPVPSSAAEPPATMEMPPPHEAALPAPAPEWIAPPPRYDTYNDGAYIYTPYSNYSPSYYPTYEPVYYDWWPRTYVVTSWWWPTCASVIIVNRDHDRWDHDRRWRDFDDHHSDWSGDRNHGRSDNLIRHDAADRREDIIRVNQRLDDRRDRIESLRQIPDSSDRRSTGSVRAPVEPPRSRGTDIRRESSDRPSASERQTDSVRQREVDAIRQRQSEASSGRRTEAATSAPRSSRSSVGPTISPPSSRSPSREPSPSRDIRSSSSSPSRDIRTSEPSSVRRDSPSRSSSSSSRDSGRGSSSSARRR